MVKVVAKSKVKKGSETEYLKLAAALADKTRIEAGCVSYQLLQDINDGSIYTFIEEWADQASLDAHMKSEHFQEIVPKMGKLREGSGEINLYHLIV
jgi:quinol monooxygenase YgiN